MKETINNFYIPYNKIELIKNKTEKEQKEILFCLFYYYNFKKLPEKILKSVKDLINCIIIDLKTIEKKKEAGRIGGLKTQEKNKNKNENIDFSTYFNDCASSTIQSTLPSTFQANLNKDKDKDKDKDIKEYKEKEKENKEDIFIDYTFCKNMYKELGFNNFDLERFYVFYKDKGLLKKDVENKMIQWDIRHNNNKQNNKKDVWDINISDELMKKAEMARKQAMGGNNG